jgi:uncharacterized protein
VSKDRLADLISLADNVPDHIKKLGFSYVTLDIMGLRSGSMNEVIKERK